MRVVSLVPSVTETLLDWGITPIAVTRFCEQPSLRAVGGTKDPDVDAIAALAPDVVVVNVEENRREDADALAERGVPLHIVGQIERVEDVAEELRRLAQRLDRVDVPSELVLPPALPITRRAFVPIWRRPWMTIASGTYGAAMLERLGIASAYADADAVFPETTLDDAAARRPDLVVAPSEPYPFGQRHQAELEHVAPVVFVDGQDLFWWGARTPRALARLAAVLHADATEGRD